MMTQKTKGRTARRQVNQNKSYKKYSNPIAFWVRTWIVTLAVWGWIPFRWGDWIVRREGHYED